MRRKSRVNSEEFFDHDQWVISILNPVRGLTGKVAGHAVLLVEGQQDASLLSEPFIGQYDVNAVSASHDSSTVSSLKNVKGYIHKINVRESNDYDHPRGNDFYHSSSQSFSVPRVKAMVMIASIKADEIQVNQGNYINYQSYGSSGGILQTLFSNQADGINCAEWCLDKLKITGIHLDVRPKPEDASGGSSCLII